MSDKCSKCGRPLKSEASKKRGYGKTCFEKILKQNNKEKMLFDRRKKDVE